MNINKNIIILIGVLAVTIIILTNYLFSHNEDLGLKEDSEQRQEMTERWIAKSSMLTPRSGAAFAVIDEKIYVIGGYRHDDFTERFALNERYDPKTDNWVTLAPMPQPRTGAVAAVVDGQIYVMGEKIKTAILLL